MKRSDGFTLVELIVVIVILAILTGVTITGVSSYVVDARKSDDIANASKMQRAVAPIVTDKYFYRHWQEISRGDEDFQFCVSWIKGISFEDFVDMLASDPQDKYIKDGVELFSFSGYIAKVLPEGLPSIQYADYFTFMISSTKNNRGELTPIVQIKAMEDDGDGILLPYDDIPIDGTELNLTEYWRGLDD